MDEPPPLRPTSLHLVCLLLLLWSALTIAVDIPRWKMIGGTLTTKNDFGELGFIAAIGLWRLWPTLGRKFAIVLSVYWLVGAGLLFFQVFPMGGIGVTSNTDFLSDVPKIVLQLGVVPFLAAQIWQIHVLNRPGIRALFNSHQR